MKNEEKYICFEKDAMFYLFTKKEVRLARQRYTRTRTDKSF